MTSDKNQRKQLRKKCIPLGRKGKDQVPRKRRLRTELNLNYSSYHRLHNFKRYLIIKFPIALEDIERIGIECRRGSLFLGSFYFLTVVNYKMHFSIVRIAGKPAVLNHKAANSYIMVWVDFR